MVKVKEDLTGKKFGRWIVIKQVEDHIEPNGAYVDMWLCICDCEMKTTREVSGSSLRKGKSLSCGCLQREVARDKGKLKKKHNLYDLSGEYGIGWTTNTNREFYFDIEDYDKIKDYCWVESIRDNGYHWVSSTGSDNKKKVNLHTLITGYSLCDHENRNTFDNRKQNLREVTYSQSVMNRGKPVNNKSGIIGVGVDKRSGKWRSYIGINRRHIFLGLFENKEDAIIARLNAELTYFGLEFAPQRELFVKYNIEQK